MSQEDNQPITNKRYFEKDEIYQKVKLDFQNKMKESFECEDYSKVITYVFDTVFKEKASKTVCIKSMRPIFNDKTEEFINFLWSTLRKYEEINEKKHDVIDEIEKESQFSKNKFSGNASKKFNKFDYRQEKYEKYTKKNKKNQRERSRSNDFKGKKFNKFDKYNNKKKYNRDYNKEDDSISNDKNNNNNNNGANNNNANNKFNNNFPQQQRYFGNMQGMMMPYYYPQMAPLNPMMGYCQR